jgi:hypothetical protein
MNPTDGKPLGPYRTNDKAPAGLPPELSNLKKGPLKIVVVLYGKRPLLFHSTYGLLSKI